MQVQRSKDPSCNMQYAIWQGLGVYWPLTNLHMWALSDGTHTLVVRLFIIFVWEIHAQNKKIALWRIRRTGAGAATLLIQQSKALKVQHPTAHCRHNRHKCRNQHHFPCLIFEGPEPVMPLCPSRVLYTFVSPARGIDRCRPSQRN